MSRSALLLAAAIAALAGTVQAAEPPGATGQYVDLLPVGMPIVVRGQLVNYVFVYVRLNLSTSANAAQLRDKEPFFRDALVRDGHRTPFVLAGDWQKVDEARLSAVLMRDAAAIAGPGQVRSVVVTSQAPQRQIQPPRAPVPPRP
jgi:hypothetical protein